MPLSAKAAVVRRSRTAVLFALALLSAGSVAAYEYPFAVETAPRGTAVDVYIKNDGPIPINVVLELTAAANTGFSPAVIGSKYTHFVLPGERKKITTAVPLKRGRPAEFRYRTRYAFGDSQAVPDPSYVYRLPFADGHRGVLRQYTAQGSRLAGNENANAVEFLVPEGTPVVASREGLVIDVRGLEGDDDSKRVSHIGNYVSVFHSDGSWANYGWLKQNSLKVKPGDRVTVGQELGVSGSNPDAIDSYIHFSVVHNFVGLALRSAPFKMKSAGSGMFDAQMTTGPVSPDLTARYIAPDRKEKPWNPPESLVPTPKVVDYSYEDSLPPIQRQILYRQRLLESATAGSDTVHGSKPLMFLAVVAVLLATSGALLAGISYSRTRPEGVRGVLWSLLRGQVPAGTEPEDHVSQVEPSLDMVAKSLASMDPTPPVVIGDGSVLPTLATDAAREPKQPVLPEAERSAPPPSPETPRAVRSDGPRAPSLMSPARARLFGLIRQACPATVLCTAHVPLVALCPATEPLPQVDRQSMVDFVLFDSEKGDVLGAILFCEADEHAAGKSVVATTLLHLGIRSITLSSVPDKEGVASSVQSFL